MKTRPITIGAILLAVSTSGLIAQNGIDPKRLGDAEAIPAPGTTQTAPKPVQQYVTGSPNEWFTRTRLYMGEFLDKEKVTGRFDFKNPTDKVVRFMNLTGTCQCARAVITLGKRKYELGKKPVANSLHRLIEKDGKIEKQRVVHVNVNPGEKGSVVVHMDMGGLQGYKDANLQITTTDPSLKQITLSWQAKGVKLFNISPNDVFLNNMKWGDERKFSFIVESMVRPDFKLLEHDPLPEFVKITSKKQIKRPNGKMAWKIDGTFGPNADPKAGGASIVYHTDWGKKEIRLSVIATVTGPITIDPGTFLSFGKIRKGKGAVRKIKITPNGDFKLNLKSVTFPRLTFDEKYISAVGEQVGKDLVISVTISPEVKGPMLVRGALLLSLDHPAVQEKKFTFNGILR